VDRPPLRIGIDPVDEPGAIARATDAAADVVDALPASAVEGLRSPAPGTGAICGDRWGRAAAGGPSACRSARREHAEDLRQRIVHRHQAEHFAALADDDRHLDLLLLEGRNSRSAWCAA
jgi:hypothetical protein